MSTETVTEEQKIRIVHDFMRSTVVLAKIVASADTAGAFTDEVITTMSEESGLSEEGIKGLIAEAPNTFQEVGSRLAGAEQIIKDNPE